VVSIKLIIYGQFSQNYHTNYTRFITGVLRAHHPTVPTAPPIRLPIPNPNHNPNPKTHPNHNPIFNPNPNPVFERKQRRHRNI